MLLLMSRKTYEEEAPVGRSSACQWILERAEITRAESSDGWYGIGRLGPRAAVADSVDAGLTGVDADDFGLEKANLPPAGFGADCFVCNNACRIAFKCCEFRSAKGAKSPSSGLA